VLPSVEDPAAWRAHLDGFLESLTPVGRLELFLAGRIALSAWRLNRAAFFELSVLQPAEEFLLSLDDYLEQAVTDGDEDAETLPGGHFPTGMMLGGATLDGLQRYEAHIHRLFQKDLHELEALQSRRLEKPATIARVDIS
jgi:hypothetical protein